MSVRSRPQLALRRSARFIVFLGGLLLLAACGSSDEPGEAPPSPDAEASATPQDASSQDRPSAPDTAAAETTGLLQRVSAYAATIEEETGPITEKTIRTGDLDGDEDTDAVVEFGIGADGYTTLHTHAVFYERTDQGWKNAGERTMGYCASFQEISSEGVVVHERRSCAMHGSETVAVHRYTYRDGTLQKEEISSVGDAERLSTQLRGGVIDELTTVVGVAPNERRSSITDQDAEHLDRIVDLHAEHQSRRRALYRDAIERVAAERRPSRRDLAERVEAHLSDTTLPVDSVEAAENYRPAVPWVNRALVVHTSTTLETDDAARWVAWPLLQAVPGVEADSTRLPAGRSSPPTDSAVFDAPVEPGDVGIERIVVEGPDRRVAVRVEGATRDADRAAHRLAEKSGIDRETLGDLRAALSLPDAFKDLTGEYPSRTCPDFAEMNRDIPFLASTARWMHFSDPSHPELVAFTHGCSWRPKRSVMIAKGTVAGDQVDWTYAHRENIGHASSMHDFTVSTGAEGRDAIIIKSRENAQGVVFSWVRAIVGTDGTVETVEVAEYKHPGGVCFSGSQYKSERVDDARVEKTTDEGLQIAVAVERATATVPDKYVKHCENYRTYGEWERPEPTVEIDRYVIDGGEVRAVEDTAGAEQASASGEPSSLEQLLHPNEIAPQESDQETVSYTVPTEESYYADSTLTREALRGKSLRALTLLRTTILAGAGYRFEVDWLNEHFRSRDWYEPGGFVLDSIPARDLKNARRIKIFEDDRTLDQLLARRAIHWARQWTPLSGEAPQSDWTPPGPFRSDEKVRTALLLDAAIAERREAGAERSPSSVPKGFGNGPKIGASVDALPSSFDKHDDNIQVFVGDPQGDGMPGIVGTMDEEGRIEKIVVGPYSPAAPELSMDLKRLADRKVLGVPTGFDPMRWEGDDRTARMYETTEPMVGPSEKYLVLHNGEPDRVCGPEDGFDEWAENFETAFENENAEQAAEYVQYPYVYHKATYIQVDSGAKRPNGHKTDTLHTRKQFRETFPYLPPTDDAICTDARDGYRVIVEGPTMEPSYLQYEFARVNGDWKALGYVGRPARTGP